VTTMRTHPPLHYASAIAMILGDWLVFGINLLLAAQGLGWVMFAVGLVTIATVFGVEQTRVGMSKLGALVRGFVAGALVSAPLPLLGTLAGVAALAWYVFAARDPSHSTSA